MIQADELRRARPQRLRALLIDESGVTSIEYALLGGLIAVVIVIAVSSVGSTLSTFFFDKVANEIERATKGGS